MPEASFDIVFRIFDEACSQRIDQDRAAFEIDLKNRSFGEGDEHRPFAGTFELQQVACAEVEDAGDGAVADTLAVHCFQPLEISIKELVCLQLVVGQIVALDVKFQAVERFGSIAIVDAAETDDDDILHLTDLEDLEAPSVQAVQMAVIAERRRIGGISLGAHFATNALRTADRRHQHGVFKLCHGVLHVKPEIWLLINEVRQNENGNGRHVAMPPV